MRHHTITRLVLSRLAETGAIMIDAFLPPQYAHASIARALLGLDDNRYSSHKPAQHALSSMLSHLKKQGLVARRGSRNKSLWSITAKGRKFLKQQNATTYRLDHDLPPEDGLIRLVTFDIPEQDRRKRDWLRSELIACGFNAIQKSVYLGKRPLPEELVARIATLNLTSHIHIIGIEKSGTLSQK